MAADKWFPMLDGPPIPWPLAEAIHRELYAPMYEQSLERIAERGGFGYSELPHFAKAIKKLRDKTLPQ